MAIKNVRETVIAVSIETSTPNPNTSAKPLISDVPNQKRMIAVIIDEIFESRMDGHARPKPSWIASPVLFPDAEREARIAREVALAFVRRVTARAMGLR